MRWSACILMLIVGCEISANGIAFQRSTITLLDEPMPIANLPGAASANVATL